jgi:hypothetical protein
MNCERCGLPDATIRATGWYADGRPSETVLLCVACVVEGLAPSRTDREAQAELDDHVAVGGRLQ